MDPNVTAARFRFMTVAFDRPGHSRTPPQGGTRRNPTQAGKMGQEGLAATLTTGTTAFRLAARLGLKYQHSRSRICANSRRQMQFDTVLSRVLLRHASLRRDRVHFR